MQNHKTQNSFPILHPAAGALRCKTGAGAPAERGTNGRGNQSMIVRPEGVFRPVQSLHYLKPKRTGDQSPGNRRIKYFVSMRIPERRYDPRPGASGSGDIRRLRHPRIPLCELCVKSGRRPRPWLRAIFKCNQSSLRALRGDPENPETPPPGPSSEKRPAGALLQGLLIPARGRRDTEGERCTATS